MVLHVGTGETHSSYRALQLQHDSVDISMSASQVRGQLCQTPQFIDERHVLRQPLQVFKNCSSVTLSLKYTK